MVKRVQNIPVMIDIDKRFEIMDRHEGYAQVLTLSAPPLENVAGPDLSPELAKLANDEMAKLVERYPDRFPAFVASLPMNNPDAAMLEIDRAIDELGATGVQVFTNVNGEPLDNRNTCRCSSAWPPSTCRSGCTRRAPPTSPTTWARSARGSTCGGPSAGRYETAVAMARLLFSGLFDRHPDLKIVTHHLGGMVPHFEGRVGGGLDQLGKRTDDPDDARRGRLKKRPIDYFRMFYGDTALFGPAHAVQCGLEFFGADHVLFGTDMPFDPEGGHGFVRDTIAAVNDVHVSDADRTLVYEANARRILRLKVTPS